MKLYELGIKAAQDGLKKGEFTSVELVQSIIERYHEKNAEIGAYLTFDEEGALALAKANPLAVPIAIKDLINVEGQPCTCGSKILEGYVSPYDATVTARLKAAGAICAGRGTETLNQFFPVLAAPGLDLRRLLAQFLPLRHPFGQTIPFVAHNPQGLVLPRGPLLILQELTCRRTMSDYFFLHNCFASHYVVENQRFVPSREASSPSRPEASISTICMVLSGSDIAFATPP